MSSSKSLSSSSLSLVSSSSSSSSSSLTFNCWALSVTALFWFKQQFIHIRNADTMKGFYKHFNKRWGLYTMHSFAYMLENKNKVDIKKIYFKNAINGRYFQLTAVTPTAALSPLPWFCLWPFLLLLCAAESVPTFLRDLELAVLSDPWRAGGDPGHRLQLHAAGSRCQCFVEPLSTYWLEWFQLLSASLLSLIHIWRCRRWP